MSIAPYDKKFIQVIEYHVMETPKEFIENRGERKVSDDYIMETFSTEEEAQELCDTYNAEAEEENDSCRYYVSIDDYEIEEPTFEPDEI